MTNEPETPPIENAESEAPQLSVVVVVVGGGDHLTRCLNAFAEQSDPPPFEIIIPVDDRFGNTTIPQSLESHVTILRCDGKRTFAELRARGARQARSPVLALTEDHCLPRPGWCAAVVKQHLEPHAAIGGPVDKIGRDSAVNWSVYLHDYGRYMSPLPAGPTDYLTDCNVTYKRRILDQYAELWRSEFHETTVNWALTKDGHTLWLAPELSVGQRRVFTFAHAVWDRYAFGRLFASTRVAETSLGRRAYYAVFTPVLPALLVARAGQTVLNKRRAIDHFLRSLPMLVLLTSVWSAGELAGYLTGTAPKALSPDPLEDAAVMDPREAH